MPKASLFKHAARQILSWFVEHHETRSILHGYFNPLVFWYQCDYLLTSKDFFFAGYLRLAIETIFKKGIEDQENEVDADEYGVG
jgi:hypothetical protein